MFSDEQLPQKIAGGQYKLVSRLGKGAMAIVYLAEVNLELFDFALALSGHQVAQEAATSDDIEVRQQQRYEELKKKPKAELLRLCNEANVAYPKDGKAAVKVMIPGSREDLLPRFEAEWRQLMGFNHDNLIVVYGGGVDGEVVWYSMHPVFDILSLDEVRALDPESTLSLIDEAAKGLQVLHDNGLVHRDMKPNNLLVSRENGQIRVRVMDLGIAKDTASGKGLTLSSHLLGTPFYMSPEQAGSTKRVDLRADIYSLGASLYSLACGRRPYEGLSMHDIVGRLLRDQQPEPALQVVPELDPRIAQLIDKMMAFDIEHRLQTMDDVRKAITAIRANDKATVARMLKPPPKSGRSKRVPSTKGKSGCLLLLAAVPALSLLLQLLW